MYQRMFPTLNVDVEAELERYKEYAQKIAPLVYESVSYLYNALQNGKKILVEGANAAMLDIDFGKLHTKLYTEIILFELIHFIVFC